MTLESVIQITASCSRGKRRLLRLTPSGATGKRKCSGTHLVQHGAAKCALPTEGDFFSAGALYDGAIVLSHQGVEAGSTLPTCQRR